MTLGTREFEDEAPSRADAGGARENTARIVWALAWPAVALNSLMVVNNLLDRGFIGHLEPAALTAQGASINVMFLMFQLAMAISTAGTAIVSRAFGAERFGEMREAARKSLSMTLIAGVGIATLGALLVPTLARLLLPASDLRAISLMESYLLIHMVGLPAMYSTQALAGALRGIGDTKSPMVISGIQILLHISLNFLLIFPSHTIRVPLTNIVATLPGANLGLYGAGLALTLSAWIAALGYVFYVGRTPLGTCWRLEAPGSVWTKRILNIAYPAAAMAVLRVSSLWVFTFVLKNVPDASAAIAAMSIGFAVESIMFMPSVGLAVAATALVGQSLGMRRPDRAERLGWLAAHHSALVILCLSVPLFAFSHDIAMVLVGGKEDIAREASMLIRTLCATEAAFGYAMVLTGAMQGAGDTRRPMWITIICLWCLRVPFAYVLSLPLAMGALGAWIAMSGTQFISGVLSAILFKRGKWKTQEV